MLLLCCSWLLVIRHCQPSSSLVYETGNGHHSNKRHIGLIGAGSMIGTDFLVEIQAGPNNMGVQYGCTVCS